MDWPIFTSVTASSISAPTAAIRSISTFIKIADLKLAPSSWDPPISAFVRSAPSSIAPLRSAPHILVSFKFASEKSAFEATDPIKRAPLRLAPLKFTAFVFELPSAVLIPPTLRSAFSRSAPCKCAFSIRAPLKSARIKTVFIRFELLRSQAYRLAS